MRKRKRALCFLLLLSLTSCQGERPFKFGEKPDSSKSFIFFRSNERSGDSFEEFLPSISSAEAQRLLLRGESLSLFVAKSGCPSCESVFPSVKELLLEIPLETFLISPSDALSLRGALSLKKTTFRNGTPGWYFLKKGDIKEILYGDEADKDVLKRRVLNEIEEVASAYNAFRPLTLEENDAYNADFSSLTYCLDPSDEVSLSLFESDFLPFLKETRASAYLLDLSFYSENEKSEARERFVFEGENYPLRYQNDYISAENLPSFLDSWKD